MAENEIRFKNNKINNLKCFLENNHNFIPIETEAQEFIKHAVLCKFKLKDHDIYISIRDPNRVIRVISFNIDPEVSFSLEQAIKILSKDFQNIILYNLDLFII